MTSLEYSKIRSSDIEYKHQFMVSRPPNIAIDFRDIAMTYIAFMNEIESVFGLSGKKWKTWHIGAHSWRIGFRYEEDALIFAMRYL